MINTPKLWNRLLEQSPKGSCLMGGAVVDYYFGMEAKDFDIFCEYNPWDGVLWTAPVNWVLTAQDFNNPEWVAEHQEQYKQGIDENGAHPIGSVNEYLVDGAHLVQLVAVMYKDPAKHFKNFDHSFTLGKYTKAGLFIHREVFKARDTKTIRYVSKNNDLAAKFKSLVRAHKKAAKYGFGYEFKGFGIKGE